MRIGQCRLQGREKLTRAIALDPARTHFLGKLPYDTYRRVLQVSAAHVYLSYPFVLSWSMLEAMASGCVVIGADTAPVREVIRHGENGWLVDFFDYPAIAERIVAALEDADAQRPLRQQARADIAARYALQQGVVGYERLLGLEPSDVTNGSNSQGPIAYSNKRCAAATPMSKKDRRFGTTNT